jgi:hypothetical protein
MLASAIALQAGIHTEICILHRMKTTLDLSDSLVAEAKALAARQHTTLTRVVEEGLRLRLQASKTSPKAARGRLPVFQGRGGLVSGVDPRSNRSMLQAAGDDDA